MDVARAKTSAKSFGPGLRRVEQRGWIRRRRTGGEHLHVPDRVGANDQQQGEMVVGGRVGTRGDRLQPCPLREQPGEERGHCPSGGTHRFGALGSVTATAGAPASDR